jgi:hypothetical protein
VRARARACAPRVYWGSQRCTWEAVTELLPRNDVRSCAVTELAAAPARTATPPSGKLQIFLSWSGPLALDVAKQLADWIPRVIQDTKPWISPKDIEKGKFWQQDLIDELQETTVGIAVVTPTNASRPWLNFEVGALARAVNPYNGVVMPLLVNMGLTDYEGPMETLQITRFDEDDFFELMKSINARIREPLDLAFLEQEYRLKFPDLEIGVEGAITRATSLDTSNARPSSRPIEEVLEGLASEIRNLRQELNEIQVMRNYGGEWRHRDDPVDQIMDYVDNSFRPEGLRMSSWMLTGVSGQYPVKVEIAMVKPYDEDALQRALEELKSSVRADISIRENPHELKRSDQS